MYFNTKLTLLKSSLKKMYLFVVNCNTTDLFHPYLDCTRSHGSHSIHLLLPYYMTDSHILSVLWCEDIFFYGLSAPEKRSQSHTKLNESLTTTLFYISALWSRISINALHQMYFLLHIHIEHISNMFIRL